MIGVYDTASIKDCASPVYSEYVWVSVYPATAGLVKYKSPNRPSGILPV